MAISFGYANFQVPARLACPPKLVLEISLCSTPEGLRHISGRVVERWMWNGRDDVERTPSASLWLGVRGDEVDCGETRRTCFIGEEYAAGSVV